MIVTTISLDPESEAALKDAARRSGKSVSQLIREFAKTLKAAPSPHE